MGDNLYFRKFFKFQVLKPLDVKTKFYNADSDDVYLEAQVDAGLSNFLSRGDQYFNTFSSPRSTHRQIQNTTYQPIHMEKVTLEASNLYDAIELNACNDDKSDERTKRRRNNMNHLDTRQYLYCLTPKQVIAALLSHILGNVLGSFIYVYQFLKFSFHCANQEPLLYTIAQR